MKYTLFAATAVGALLGAVPQAATAQDYVLKVSAPVPPTERDVVYAWMVAFERDVEARTNGAIDVQLYPANQLGQLPAAVEGVSMGTIEVTFSIIGFLSTLDPRFRVLDAGGLFDTPEHAMRSLQTPQARDLMAEFGALAGVQPLVTVIDGQGILVSREPIESLADFEGLKTRVGGSTPLLTQPLQALGAAPVAMPLGEVVPGLQTGTIDAATNSIGVAIGFQMADVAPHVTYIPGNYTTVAAVINTGFLDRIGPDLAQIVLDVARENESVIFSHLAAAGAMEGAWQNAGGSVTRLSDADVARFLEITNPIVAEIVAQDAQMQADYDGLAAAAAAAR